MISRNTSLTTAVRGGVCRFSSPSIFSMHIAAEMLQDRAFIRQYLERGREVLLKQRLLVEALLDEVGLEYYREG